MTAHPTAADFGAALDAYCAANYGGDWQSALARVRAMAPPGVKIYVAWGGSSIRVEIQGEIVANLNLDRHPKRTRDERMTAIAWAAILAMGAALQEAGR